MANSKLISAALTLLALTGCVSMREVAERHPRITGAVAASLVLSAGGALRGHSRGDDRHIDTPSVNCDSGACR